MPSKYNNKHTFLSEATSPHTINLILNLIHKDILKKIDLLIILYGEILSNKSIEETCLVYDIDVLRWDEAKELNLSFLTLNPLSLSSAHAKIIIYCINENYIKTSNVNILMLDDELDRWNKLYEKTGCLQINSTALIDENVLNILKVVDNYIIPYNTTGERLEEIVGRRLNIIDAILPFSVLDYQSQAILENFLDTRKQFVDKSHPKVLIFTKPYSMKNSFYAIVAYLIKSKNTPFDKEITLGVWFNSNLKGFILSKIISSLIKATKAPVHIEFLRPTTHGQYFLMLNDYNCLILQGRGGFSTTKYFGEKVGKVITLIDTPNDLTLKRHYGINTFSYKNLSLALNAAIERSQVNETEEINLYANTLVEKHENSFKVLEEFWSCF